MIRPTSGPVDLGQSPHSRFLHLDPTLYTRPYFSEKEKASAKGPVLNLIEPKHRRKRLIAKRTGRDGKVVHVFDIVLQGENEAVFFDI